MKVLQIINAFYPPCTSGGAGFVVHDISKVLARRGHQVTVYTTNVLSRNQLFSSNYKKNYYEGMFVYYFNNILYNPSLSIEFSYELYRSIKENILNYDIIHIHEYRSYISLVVSYYAHKYNIPIILQAHGQLPRIISKQRSKWFFDTLLGYRLLKNCSKIIALNQMESRIYKNIGIPNKLITIIPNGIDFSEYNHLPPKGNFRIGYNLNKDEKIVLFLGRINKIKGIDILIKAFTDVVKNLDGVRLVVVGPDDGSLEELQTLVKDMNIENKVTFTGPLYGLKKIEAYVDSDVYILPSRYETFPMTLLEAYACGKPIIASNVGGLKDLVINNVTGLFFDSGDVEYLARNILYLLNNESKSKEMGFNGRQLVKDNFTLENVVDQLEKVYNDAHVQNRIIT